MSNLIEKAVRTKLRFNSTKGLLTTEQLFDLPFTSKSGFDLQSVATTCDVDLKACGDTDFVGTGTTKSAEAQLRLDVVKHVIAILQKERSDANKTKATKEQKQKLLTLLEQSKDAELAKKSPEELQAMIDAL